MIDRLLRFAGKKDFKIDERISKGYISRLCLQYGLMMIRGKITALGYQFIENSIFVGKNVKLLEKKYLTIGKKTKLHEGVMINALSTEGVKIGSHVVLGRNSVIECTGSLQNLGKGLIIGNRTTFGNDCFFGAAGGIEVGEDVVAGQFIRFHSENHNYSENNVLIREQGVTREGIKVGSNCWLGSGVVFLDGAEIGNGCVVAANAVVTKKFPNNVVIGGVPARVLKTRDKEI